MCTFCQTMCSFSIFRINSNKVQYHKVSFIKKKTLEFPDGISTAHKVRLLYRAFYPYSTDLINNANMWPRTWPKFWYLNVEPLSFNQPINVHSDRKREKGILSCKIWVEEKDTSNNRLLWDPLFLNYLKLVQKPS